ncbi:hypothetical protein MUG87_17555 [Ectobacillus sp. JY-23]|uniref:tetratricopeptide repeat protein n=1 Tax=Ectobacillus sp. JY-23 TaxID=2933872 RepID=UPI001FF545AE|nr:hypothetical protein [Ectobacillus sp. JY-23]UOY92217.1 hypothetical protein MUG87_17555 [Ectobacillus sp. JY-23]
MELKVYTVPIVLFYIIHAAVVLVLMKLVKKKNQEDLGVWKWVAAMSIILPIISPLLGYIVWRAAKRIQHDTLHSYDTYIDFSFLNYDEVAIEARKGLELTSFSVGLQGGNANLRKHLIVRLMEMEFENRGAYLAKALHSVDTETVHYAATTMNHVKESYERMIDEQEKQLSEDDVHSYLTLCNTYNQCIRSKIMDEAMEKRLYAEFQYVLEEALSLFPNHLVFADYLVFVYQAMGERTAALELAEEMVKKFPTNSEGYIRLLALYFEQHDFRSMKYVYQNLQRNVREADIPASVKPVLDVVRSV